MTQATKGGTTEVMTEHEKQMLKTFALLIPELSDSDKSYLIGLGEGMAIKARQENEKSGQFSAKDVAVAGMPV